MFVGLELFAIVLAGEGPRGFGRHPLHRDWILIMGVLGVGS
jgi:hypothetical protein